MVTVKKYFDKLHFEESIHKYYVDGEPLKTSVSGVVGKFGKVFDSHNISLGVAKKEGRTQAEVLQEWKDISDKACDLGNEVHLFGEDYFSDRTLKPSNGFEEAIVKFWDSLPSFLIPAFPELQMYHFEKMFGGTADIILYNTKTGKFVILDYKTNKDLFKNFKGQTLLAPFDYLLDCPYNKYQIQLSLYQILLEQTGVEVSSRKIIWLKPDGEFELYDAIDLTDELRKQIKKLEL